MVKTRSKSKNENKNKSVRPKLTAKVTRKTNSNAVKTRSPASIIAKLATGMKTSSSLKAPESQFAPYTLCRMNPFKGKGGTEIPDGGNSRFLSLDMMSVDNFSVSSSGTVVLQTLPVLPFAGMISCSGTNVTINGATLTAPASMSPNNANTNSFWYPTSVFNNYTSAVTCGTNYIDSAGSVSGRIAALAYRIYYTGPVNTCAGTISVTSNDVSFEYCGATTSSTAGAPAAGLVSVTLGALTQTAIAATVPSGTPIVQISSYNSPTALNRTTYTIRPEEGLLIVPKHKTNDFKIRDMYDTPAVMVGIGPLTPGSAHYSVFTAGAYNTGGSNTIGILLHDSDWSSYQVCFNNINADASYRIETIACVELNPNQGTFVASLTKDQSPSEPAVMHQTSQLMNAISPVTPLTGRLE
jgi:hypothetical protein